MKQKAEMFFFGVVFLSCFAMVFSLVKQTQNPAFKKGLNDWAKVSTQNMR